MTPFPGGIEAYSNGLLIFSVALGLLYFYMRDLPQSWKKSAVKTGSIALLALLAARESGPLLLVLGLALSALGDFLLSRDGDKFFLGGLVSFLLAHVAYVALFLQLGAGLGSLAGIWTVAAILALAAFCFALLRALLRHIPPDMKAPVMAYTAAILAMGVTSLTTGNVAVIAGALMFMASDSFLAWERFAEPAGSSRRGWMRIAVWGLYYGAQVAITLGVLVG